MATSDNDSSSGQFSPAKLKASLLRSEQRRAAVRARRNRQWRNLAGLLAVLVLCGFLCWRVAQERHGGPPAPVLVIIWPKAKFQQQVSNGATVLGRVGQSFTVTVANPNQWRLQWATSDTLAQGASTLWQPTRDGATLTARCHPVANGWLRLVAWLWPERTVTVQSRLAIPIEGRRYKITPPVGGLWLFPFVRAEVPVAWDEHALPFLLNGSPPMRWMIVPTFNRMAPTAGDTGTYARLLNGHPDQALPPLARQIAVAAPTASIQFMVNMSRDAKQPSTGILRIAFDGKGERGGTLQRAGGTDETVKWWDELPSVHVVG